MTSEPPGGPTPGDAPDALTSPPPPAPPTTVVAASALVGLEAVALLAYAAVYTAEVLPFGPDPLTRALIAGGVVLFLLMAAAALAAAAWALRRLKHWPRSLLVVVQLIVLAIMFPLAVDGLWAGWAAVAVAVAVLALVMAPATTAAIER